MLRRPLILLVLLLALLSLLAACSGPTPEATVTSLPPTAVATPAAAEPPTVPPLPDATESPTAPQAPVGDGTITIDGAATPRAIASRLLGTNVPAWLNEGLTAPVLVERAVAADLTVFRMPGGSWSNTYPWLACQTERADPCAYAGRPSDFIDLLKATGAEGMWIVSFNGTAEEAAALVAFFNGVVSDERPIGVDPRGVDWKTVGHWAQLRSEFGHPEPVGIKLWEVGNEVYGGKPGTGKECADWGWEDGWTCDGLEYVEGRGTGTERRQGFLEFRSAMRAVDSSILVGAVGIPLQNEWENWGNEVISAAGQEMDFYSVHQYAFYEPPRTLAEVLAEPQQTWPRLAADVRRAFERYANGRAIPIAITEYNLFSFQDNDTQRLMTRAVNMLHLADTIGQLAEHEFAMANQWNLANGVTESFGNYGMLDAGSLERYPQYYVFPLWARFGNALLPVESSFDAQRTLSVYAGQPEAGVRTLLVINKADSAQTATIALNGVSAVTGGTADIAQATSLEAMSVSFNGIADPAHDLSDAPPTPLRGLSPRFNYTFAPYSITLLRLDVTP